MRNEILDKETIQARLQIIKLLKSAIAETCNLNTHLDNLRKKLHRADTPKKAA